MPFQDSCSFWLPFPPNNLPYTPALDLSTSGNDYEEVKKRFNEIVNIFFEELIKRGTLENVLKNLGWKRFQTKWNPPVVISQESQSVKVPVG